MVSLFLLAQQIYHQQWYRICCYSCKFMTFALNCRTMSRPPSCTFCTLFCYIFTLFSLLKTNPCSIKWILQQALIKLELLELRKTSLNDNFKSRDASASKKCKMWMMGGVTCSDDLRQMSKIYSYDNKFCTTIGDIKE